MVGRYHYKAKVISPCTYFFSFFSTKFSFKLDSELKIVNVNKLLHVFGYTFYIHSCLSPSVRIWTKSTFMRGCWVASQYGPHLLVSLARLGHIEKQPTISACRLIFKIYPSVPSGYIFPNTPLGRYTGVYI